MMPWSDGKLLDAEGVDNNNDADNANVGKENTQTYDSTHNYEESYPMDYNYNESYNDDDAYPTYEEIQSELEQYKEYSNQLNTSIEQRDIQINQQYYQIKNLKDENRKCM